MVRKMRLIDLEKDVFASFDEHAVRGEPILVNNHDHECPQWPTVFFYEGRDDKSVGLFGRDIVQLFAKGIVEIVPAVGEGFQGRFIGAYDAHFLEKNKVRRLLDATGESYKFAFKRGLRMPSSQETFVYCVDEIHFGEMAVVERLRKYLGTGR